MTEIEWTVEVEESVMHVKAADRKEALSRALQLIMLKAFPKKEEQPPQDPNRDYLKSCIDNEVIESLTDTELFEAIDRINKELNYRQTDFLTIPNYCGVKKED